MFNQDLFVDFTIALLAFVNPLYTVPVFLSMTQGFDNGERLRTSLTAAATMFIAIVLTVIIGDQLLLFLGVDIPSFKVAGGLIILVLAFKMLFLESSSPETTAELSEEIIYPENKNIGVYPLTVPLLAGPGMFTTAIIFSGRLTTISDFAEICAAAFVITFQFWVSMVFASAAARFLNNNTVRIGTSILGILLAAVSVELVLSGIRQFVLAIETAM